MHAFVIGLGLTLATAAVAQQPAGQPAVQAIKTFASSAGVVALVAQAKSERKEGQALVSEYILRLPPAPCESRVPRVYRHSSRARTGGGTVLRDSMPPRRW